jgi:large subunit ribosomal protein L17
MRHLKSGNKLGVNASHRLALLRGITISLLEHDSIKTTRARAQEAQAWADRVVTLAKRGGLASRREIIRMLGHSETRVSGRNRVRMAVGRLYEEILPRFTTRVGGYSQIVKLGIPRAGDQAEMCVLRYLPTVEQDIRTKKKKDASDKKKERNDRLDAQDRR